MVEEASSTSASSVREVEEGGGLVVGREEDASDGLVFKAMGSDASGVGVGSREGGLSRKCRHDS